jgi:hypothetical protein
MLEDLLDHNRQALIDTARGLSNTDARRRLVGSLTAPISLIKHAAAAERIWRRDEGTFTVAVDESLEDVIAEYERASQRSREIASRFDLDDTIDIPGEGNISMRWTLLLMLQEFARHAGHGDILREQIDAARSVCD